MKSDTRKKSKKSKVYLRKTKKNIVKEEKPAIIVEKEDFKEDKPAIVVEKEDFKEEPDLMKKSQKQILSQSGTLINEIYTKLNIVTEEIPNVILTSNDDWYMNLNSKQDNIPVIVYLELHGIGQNLLKKHVVDHILDTFSHEDRLILAKQVKEPGFIPDSPLEKHIAEYFDFLTIKDGERTCLVLTKNETNVFYNVNDWTKETIDADDEMYKDRFFVDIDDLSDIFGYVNTAFRINDNGRVYSQNSSKNDLIVKMNTILKLSGSNYWYDTSTTKDKPKRNSDNLSKIAFYAIIELLIRKLNQNKANDKIWFLRPEQFVFMKS
jgi:hypothetical protein